MSGSKKKGPFDFWSMLRSSKSFRERLARSKYARWAQDLREEEFLGVLSAVGEFGCRADEPLEILRRHGPRYGVSSARAMVGLKILADFTKGRSRTEEQVAQTVRDAVAAAQRLDYVDNVCARRWTLKELEAIRESDGEEYLFRMLFSAFTQQPPLPASVQQRMGNYLRRLKPRGTGDLPSIVRWSLVGWDSRVAQLPLYFRDVYGVAGLRLALDRLDSDVFLSAQERKALRSFNRWLHTRPEAERITSPKGGAGKRSSDTKIRRRRHR